MRNKDIINIRGYRQPCVNVSYTVGNGSANRPPDVRLIQALFNYIGYEEQSARNYFNLSYPMEIPVITGFFDTPTSAAIWSFQRKWALNLLSQDGVIHPADYKGRIIKDTTKPLMAITLLHLLATDTGVINGENYLFGLKKLEPQLLI